MTTQLYAVFSTTEGPDGNGVLTPFDPGAGGIVGGTSTSDNAFHLCTGAILPADKQSTDLEVVVLANQGIAGAAPTGAWRARVGVTVIRNGNSLIIQGSSMSSDVRSAAALSSLKAAIVVDSSVSPNLLAVQVKGLNTAPAITWVWRATTPFSLAT